MTRRLACQCPLHPQSRCYAGAAQQQEVVQVRRVCAARGPTGRSGGPGPALVRPCLSTHEPAARPPDRKSGGAAIIARGRIAPHMVKVPAKSESVPGPDSDILDPRSLPPPVAERWRCRWQFGGLSEKPIRMGRVDAGSACRRRRRRRRRRHISIRWEAEIHLPANPPRSRRAELAPRVGLIRAGSARSRRPHRCRLRTGPQSRCLAVRVRSESGGSVGSGVPEPLAALAPAPPDIPRGAGPGGGADSESSALRPATRSSRIPKVGESERCETEGADSESAECESAETLSMFFIIIIFFFFFFFFFFFCFFCFMIVTISIDIRRCAVALRWKTESD